MWYAVGIYKGDIPVENDAERIWFRSKTSLSNSFWSNDPHEAHRFATAIGARYQCDVLNDDYDTMVITEADMKRVKNGTLNLLAFNPAEHKNYDVVVQKYAGILKGVYNNRTADDNTFENVLTAMLKEIK